ncbi:replication initiator protein [Apis mellifera associated microvirus 28]|nr:replication initiator protein [Apis mellifera associated microvirus 28]
MSRCYTPIEIPNKERPDTFLTVPCGQCIGCRLNRAESWAARMMHEASLHDHNSFITLTYADHHLPPDGSLAPHDITLFFKRLRKALKGKKILYYYCGEYGENFSRPHYHIALFNEDFHSDRIPHRKTPTGEIYRSPMLEKLWTYGHSEIGNLEYDSARYVAGYIQKKVNGKKASEHYVRINHETGEAHDVHPEFARMSRRPAIGLNWISNFSTDIYNYDVCHVAGKKLRPPAYYDKWLKKNDEQKFTEIKLQRESSQTLAPTKTQDDLTRTYEAKVIASKQISRSLEGVPAHTPDRARLDYYTRRKDENHFYQKAKNGN